MKADASSFNLGETECVRGQGSALEAVVEEAGGVSQRSKGSLRQEEEAQPQAEDRSARQVRSRLVKEEEEWAQRLLPGHWHWGVGFGIGVVMGPMGGWRKQETRGMKPEEGGGPG